MPLILVIVGLSACSTAVVPPPAGGSVTTVHVVSSSGAAAVAGAIAFAAIMEVGDPGYLHSSTSFAGPAGWFWTRPVPELDPDRRISEQDCTKPLDFSQGNIRCK